MGRPLSALLVAGLWGLAATACRSDTLFISSLDLPTEGDWLLLATLDASGRFVRASGLAPSREGALRLEGEPLEPDDQLVVMGFREAELEGRVAADEASRALPFRVASERDPILPRPAWQVGRAVVGAVLEPVNTTLALTSEAMLPCPELGASGAPAVFQTDCATAPCVPNVVQDGCRAELDFRSECGAGRVRGRLDARGGLEPALEDEWFGTCAAAEPEPGSPFRLECTKGAERRCEVQGRIVPTSPRVAWDTLRVVPEAPDTTSSADPERLAGAIVPLGEDTLLLFGPPRGSCSSGAPQRLYFIDRGRFSVVRTATVGDCLVHLGPDPSPSTTGSPGLLAIGVDPLAWVRMDAAGRVVDRQAISLEHQAPSLVPLSVVYHPGTHRLVASFGAPDRDDRRFVEYLSFDADTLAAGGQLLGDGPRAELLGVAWGELVILDDDREALRFVSPLDFTDGRSITLSLEMERRNYVRIGFFPSLDQIAIRVSGRFRSLVLVGRDARPRRAFSFETTSFPYAYAPTPWDSGQSLLMGFYENTGLAPSGYLSLLRPETAQFEPGLTRLEVDTPDDMYSDDRDAYVYVLQRRSGRLLRVRPAEP